LDTTALLPHWVALGVVLESHMAAAPRMAGRATTRPRCSRTNGEDGRDAVACPNIAGVRSRVWPLVLLSTVCPAAGA
jgi:hypothetical protein